MKNLYKAVVTIEDKGEVFERTEEVISKSNSTIINDLKKQLNKYRAALGLSKNYKVLNYKAQHIGWV